MTRATLCAVLAALLASGALADLASRPRARRTERRRRGTLTANDLPALKAVFALIAGVVVLPTAAALPANQSIVLLAAAVGAAFYSPDLWLRHRARARAAQMQRELGDVLDLLRVAVEAGLPVTRALAEVGRRHAGPLAEELRTTATAIELGVPREGALAALAQRAPLPAVATLTAAIERAERHGAPLADALEALATDARAERGRALTERAAKAAPKIQLAVALLLVPAAILVIAAGAMSSFV
jgi:tight adherence protein C